MASIDELMRGKKPGEIKIRRSGWPRSRCVIPTEVVVRPDGLRLWVCGNPNDWNECCAYPADESTDWVIVTDAKPRR